MSASGRQFVFHLQRALFAPLVALLTWAAFPRAEQSAPAQMEAGRVAGQDVIAPMRFVVRKPEAERAREAETLARTVKPIIRYRPAEGAEAGRAVAQFFAALDSATAAGASLEDAARAHGVTLTAAEAAELARPSARRAMRHALAVALSRTAPGTLAPGLSEADLGRQVVLRSEVGERVAPVESLATFSDFLEVADALRPAGATAAGERLYVRLLGAFFRPTLAYEREETERHRDVLRRSVDSVVAVVLAGERIVGAHEVVSEEAVRKIDALRGVMARRAAGTIRGALGVLGAIGTDTLIIGLFGVICFFYRPDVYRSTRSLGVFAGAIALVAVVAGLLADQAPGRIELIPVALPGILLAVLFDGRIAAVAAMTLAALIGAQPAMRGTDALVFCFVGGVGAALSMRRIRHRTQVFAAIGIVTALYAGAAAVSGAAAEEPIRAIGASALYGGLNALGSAALAMLILPVAESYTHVTTDLRLLELGDPNRPLLRRLATEAPGTYAHSVAMANLCEAACNAIGANGLLARVGCYYHDVGKLRRPVYFAENQGHVRSPHEQLTAEQSAGVIRRHVADGLALAEEHHLPDVIRRFIPEHHGTSPISYFLERAREEMPAASLREEDFHYPGPLPQSAETAVALLADSVEAALRVLDDPTPERIEDAIQHLVRTRIEAGQLREAPLTLRQVETVEREFVRVLTSMHHNRVEYPEDAGGLTADWEPSRAD